MPHKDKQKRKEYQKNWYINSKRSRKNNPMLKEQNDIRMRRRRKELKDWFSGVTKDIKCKFCEEDDRICLDFHHIDPQKKYKDISILFRNRERKEVILAELSKCVVLCSNCHRKLHAGSLKL